MEPSDACRTYNDALNVKTSDAIDALTHIVSKQCANSDQQLCFMIRGESIIKKMIHADVESKTQLLNEFVKPHILSTIAAPFDFNEALSYFQSEFNEKFVSTDVNLDQHLGRHHRQCTIATGYAFYVAYAMLKINDTDVKEMLISQSTNMTVDVLNSFHPSVTNFEQRRQITIYHNNVYLSYLSWTDAFFNVSYDIDDGLQFIENVTWNDLKHDADVVNYPAFSLILSGHGPAICRINHQSELSVKRHNAAMIREAKRKLQETQMQDTVNLAQKNNKLRFRKRDSTFTYKGMDGYSFECNSDYDSDNYSIDSFSESTIIKLNNIHNASCGSKSNIVIYLEPNNIPIVEFQTSDIGGETDIKYAELCNVEKILIKQITNGEMEHHWMEFNKCREEDGSVSELITHDQLIFENYILISSSSNANKDELMHLVNEFDFDETDEEHIEIKTILTDKIGYAFLPIRALDDDGKLSDIVLKVYDDYTFEKVDIVITEQMPNIAGFELHDGTIVNIDKVTPTKNAARATRKKAKMQTNVDGKVHRQYDMIAPKAAPLTKRFPPCKITYRDISELQPGFEAFNAYNLVSNDLRDNIDDANAFLDLPLMNKDSTMAFHGTVGVYQDKNKNRPNSFPFVLYSPRDRTKKSTRHGTFEDVVTANIVANWLSTQSETVCLTANSGRTFLEDLMPVAITSINHQSDIIVADNDGKIDVFVDSCAQNVHWGDAIKTPMHMMGTMTYVIPFYAKDVTTSSGNFANPFASSAKMNKDEFNAFSKHWYDKHFSK